MTLPGPARHLVLGGSGFVGRHVALRLAQMGQTVTIADLEPPPAVPSHTAGNEISFVRTNVQNTDWDALLSRCDIVHHYVWTTTPQSAGAAPLADLSDNVGSTITLLEAMRRQRGKSLVFASSGGTVYGRLKTVPVSEDHVLEPISAYGASKVAAEVYIGYFCRHFGLDARIARLSNPFGAGQNPKTNLGAAATFLLRAMNGEAISIWGDGSVVRDYIHIADAAEALAQLSMARNMATNGAPAVFNIGSGVGRSLKEIVEIVRALVKREIRVDYLEGRSFDVPVSVLDISRAKAALNWQPRFGLEAGLARMHNDLTTGSTFYSSLH